MQAVESLKICTLMGFFCPKHIKFQIEKYKRVMSDALKRDAKFEEKLTLGFKNDMRNLTNFDSSLESLKICTIIGSF